MTQHIEEATVGYVMRYGGMCRDCADMDGVCQSGMPCDTDQRRAVIRHTIAALTYGIKHGFITSPFTETITEIRKRDVSVEQRMRAEAAEARIAELEKRLADAEREAADLAKIPIAAAKRIADDYGYDQVVIYARRCHDSPEPHGEHMTTYGRTKEHCGVAARMGATLQKFMGWEI